MPVRKSYRLLAALSVALFIVMSAQAQVGDYQRVAGKTLAKDEFVFPDDLPPSRVNVLFVAISDSQESGERQGDLLRAWHAELAAQGLLTADMPGYHFPVMQGVPFFVKGLVSRGMRKVYGETIPLEQVAILHVDSVAEFAASIGVPDDGKPTVVLVSGTGDVLALFHGYEDEVDIAAIAQAIGAFSEVPEEAAESP